MGRTKGSTTAAKVVKSDSGNKEATKVSSHGYTPEETEAAFFLFMDDQKKKEPGLKLSDAVGLWNALPFNEKNVSTAQTSSKSDEKFFKFLFYRSIERTRESCLKNTRRIKRRTMTGRVTPR